MSEQLKLPNYGGQALIEGVLMRGPSRISSAFRLPDQSIITQIEDLPKIYRTKFFMFPFIRGLTILWDALILGYKYLMISANHQVDEKEKIDKKSFLSSLVLTLLIAIGLFFVGPGLLGKWIGGTLDWSTLGRNLFEGFFRLFLVILYLLFIGKNKDISRVFQYHGAEHKTINAFESGHDLTPEKAQKESRYHPRCGTSFTLSFVFFSIIIFALLGDLPIIWIIATRIFALPFIAMISYEYIRFLSKYINNPLIKILSYPNMLIQKLTTREPNAEMLEVSITAFKGLEVDKPKFQ